MKKLLCIALILLAGCASSAVIKTVPEQVRVYQDGQFKGVTPYDFWDRALSGHEETYTLKKEGYQDKTITVKKNVLYVHRIFAPPVLAWPWLLGYDTSYSFEME